MLSLEALEPRNAPSGAYFDQALGLWEGLPIYDPLHPQDGLIGAVAPASPAQDAATEAIMAGVAGPGMSAYYPPPPTTGLSPQHVDQVMQTYHGAEELAWAGATMQVTGAK